MFRMNPTNILRILFVMAVIIVVPGTASEANSFTVTVMPESSTTWYAGYLDQGYQSESDDPLAPFGGQSVMFKGYIHSGSAAEMRENAYLVCRYKIEFDRDVTFDSVAVTGAGDNTSKGNDAVLRLLDENMYEITVEPLTGFNTLLTHTLNTGGVLGRIFYIDEFDYSMGYRYRKNIKITYHDFEVTNTNDSGSGSLRQAILEANTNPGLDVIAFNISGRSKGPYTIQPLTSLPQITDPVIIDGYTQPGAKPNTNGPGLGNNAVLQIELDGSETGPGVNGLHITAGSSTVRGLVINRFGSGEVEYSCAGIQIEGNGGNIVEGNFIGIDVTGTITLGNSGSGVRITSPGNVVGGATAAASNVISGNGYNGVFITSWVLGGNVVQGNFLGTNATGTMALGNSFEGVRIAESPNNTVGGMTPGAGNVISGNANGISILGVQATGNRVQGNFIGTDVTGTLDIGNDRRGVFLEASNNTVGGTTVAAGNVISGNGFDGIYITGVYSTGEPVPWAVTENLVQCNLIGTDVTGTAALGNIAGGLIIEASANNTITDNTISNNVYGIRLQSSSDNQIYNNNFIDNITQAYADTNSVVNIFNLEEPIGGNYWSDWTTLDARGDGFVDSPYIFTGGVDYLPWARQDGWLPPQTLSEALDTPLSFITGGQADWFSQTTTSYYDGDAARSGYILDKQESWMQTTVSGAGTMTFYWKVSSEAGYDFLEFYADGSLQDLISGSVDWQQKTFTIAVSDSHTLEWRYVKDKCMDSGSDCGWLDKVEWVPSP